MLNSSIWPIDRTWSGAITPGQSGPGNDGNEGILQISQSFSITGASLSDAVWVSYPGHVLEQSYPFAEMQLVYSAAPANKAMLVLRGWRYIHAHTHTHTQIQFRNGSLKQHYIQVHKRHKQKAKSMW